MLGTELPSGPGSVTSQAGLSLTRRGLATQTRGLLIARTARTLPLALSVVLATLGACSGGTGDTTDSAALPDGAVDHGEDSSALTPALDTADVANVAQGQPAVDHGGENGGEVSAGPADTEGSADDSGPVDDPAAPDSTAPDSTAPDPNAPKPILTAEGACQAPVIIPDDSLVITETAHSMQFPGTTKDNFPIVSHIMGVEVDLESGLAFAVGLPGLFIFGEREDGSFWHLGEWPPGAATGATSYAVDDLPAHGDVAEYNHAQPLGQGLVAVTARGNPAPEFMFGPGHPAIEGLFVLDATEPSEPFLVSELDISDASSLAWQPPYLYVGSYLGDLWVVDLTDAGSPGIVGHLEGALKNPWTMTIVDDLAYVADNNLGVAVLDLTVPTEPTFIGNSWTESGAQDLSVGDGYVYVAVGGAGVETFDIGDPLSPVSTGVVDTGPSATSLDVGDGILWVVNQESVTVFDLTDPAVPVQVAVQETPFWALGVAADGLGAYVADWCAVHRVAFDPGISSPEADLHPEELFFWDGAASKTFEVHNRGDGLLQILGAVPEDPRVSVMWDSLVVPPGERATGFVFVDQEQLGEGTEPLDGTVCIATNDPDSPLQDITVAATSPFTDVTYGAINEDAPPATSVTIGQPAPDFILTDLDGGPHTLSDHLGQPVVLIFFSTW